MGNARHRPLGWISAWWIFLDIGNQAEPQPDGYFSATPQPSVPTSNKIKELNTKYLRKTPTWSTKMSCLAVYLVEQHRSELNSPPDWEVGDRTGTSPSAGGTGTILPKKFANLQRLGRRPHLSTAKYPREAR